MFAVRAVTILLLIIASCALLSGCQGDSAPGSRADSRSVGNNFQWQPIYGDRAKDPTAVIAKVGEIEFTERDLELYLDELPSLQRAEFDGPSGERLVVKRMVENALYVQGAVEKELYNDPDVARTIISTRRNALRSAMINYGLLRDNGPSEEDVREYFQNNRENYRQLGMVEARHIECLTQEDADDAFSRLTAGGKGNDWMSVLVTTTVNEESKELEGSTGWFNLGGVIPYIANSQKFIQEVYEYEIGIHPPLRIGDRWHVVEVLTRREGRPMTFAEGRTLAEADMLPAWQDGILRDYLLESRADYPVELYGRFAPGQGLTVDELFARAAATVDPQKKIELLNLVHTDYAESGRADDALFMAAMISLETWADVKVADRYLVLLLKEYPDSDLADDAQFLRENLYNPEALNPQSIDSLRK